MNEHRAPQNLGTEGQCLAKALQDLPGGAKPHHSWLDDARNSAFSAGNYVEDTAVHAPIGTALGALAIGLAAYGAVRTGLAAKELASVAEGELLGGGTEAAATGAKTMVHLTTAEGEIGIANTLKVGSRWGVFGLESSQVPENALVRNLKSLVTKDLVSEIHIGPNASSYFKAPTPVGPFSLARSIAGVKSTPLGSIDLAKDAFIPNEIFSNGVFRSATKSEITNYKVHQWLLDYGVDSLAYTWAGFTAASMEYKQICARANNRGAKWRLVTSQDLHK